MLVLVNESPGMVVVKSQEEIYCNSISAVSGMDNSGPEIQLVYNIFK